MGGDEGEYQDYDEIPAYRQHGIFWLIYVLFGPMALLILITGDVYYLRNDKIKRFGIINRVAAGLILAVPVSLIVVGIVMELVA